MTLCAYERAQLREYLREIERDLKELHDPGVKRHLIEKRKVIRRMLGQP